MKHKKTQKHYALAHISDELHEQASELIEAVRTSDNPKKHRDEITATIVALIDEGTAFFFLMPLKKIKVNTLVYQATSVGISGVRRTVKVLMKRVINGLSKKQLLSAVDVLEELLYPDRVAEK